MAIPVKMPQLGESVVKGTIIRWLKEPGDIVKIYDPLVEVESDKVITEIPATANGTLLQILVPTGETAEVGTVLAYLGRPDEAIASPASVTEVSLPGTASGKPKGFTPAVLRLAEKHRLSLDTLQAIPGTGRDGRVSKRDVLHYLETRPQASPVETIPRPVTEISQPKDNPANKPDLVEKSLELTPMRAAIAEHMLRSIQTSPHVTSVFEVDLKRVVAYRQAHREEFSRQGISLAYTAFFVQAAAEALKAYPLANASLIAGKIVLHPQINIGIAVAVEGGLLVPVIREAENMSLAGLARAIHELARRARAKTLTPAEVQGGTFTVTNPGMQGALLGTAIIHQPQAAILGVGAIVKRPVVIEEDAIVIRPMVYLSLTYDHRIMDGFGANQVLATIQNFLENYQ